MGKSIENGLDGSQLTHLTASQSILSRLYTEYSNALLRYFSRKVPPHEAPDLVQDVFVRLARLHDLNQIDQPEAFLFTIARNLLRDRARRAQTARRLGVEHRPVAEINFEEPSAERVLMGKQEITIVEQALLELPERTRTVFILHKFKYMKYKEIATKLHISVSAVEKHMMESLRHIAFRLGKTDSDKKRK